MEAFVFTYLGIIDDLGNCGLAKCTVYANGWTSALEAFNRKKVRGGMTNSLLSIEWQWTETPSIMSKRSD